MGYYTISKVSGFKPHLFGSKVVFGFLQAASKPCMHAIPDPMRGLKSGGGESMQS